jgi:hypothetical protein
MGMALADKGGKKNRRFAAKRAWARNLRLFGQVDGSTRGRSEIAVKAKPLRPWTESIGRPGAGTKIIP